MYVRAHHLKSGCAEINSNIRAGIDFRGNVAYLSNTKVKNTGNNEINGNNNAVFFTGYSLHMDKGKNDLRSTGNKYNIRGSVWPEVRPSAGVFKHNAIFCDKNVWDLTTFAWNYQSLGNCFVENTPIFVGTLPVLANLIGPSKANLPLSACQFIDIGDPWNRDHGSAFAYFSNRVAPVLQMDSGDEFNNMTLDDAVDLTIETFYDDLQPTTAVLTIDRAAAILTHNFGEDLDTLSLSFYQDAYNILMEAAVEGVQNDEILVNGSGTIPTAIQTVFNTQNTMLQNIETVSNTEGYKARYSIQLNQAMLHRLILNHQEAINILNVMNAWINADDQLELDFLKCHAQYEMDIHTGVIDAYDTDLDTVYSCYTYLNSSSAFKTSVEEELTTTSSALNVFPNPSSGVCEIHLSNIKNGQYPYQIYNLNGSLVKEGMLDFTASGRSAIDYRDLNDGLYIFKLQTPNKSLQKKLIKE